MSKGTETASKVADYKESKRILITNVNGLLGHSLFETMRNDHITIHSNGEKTPHRFLGTFNNSSAGGIVNPSPSDSIKLLDSKSKPKTFTKQVRGSDVIILDVSQLNTDYEEAEKVIKALKFEDGAHPEKAQVLIVISSAMSWSKTAPKANGAAFTEADLENRVPLPKYQRLK